jgi:hypothetical protein
MTSVLTATPILVNDLFLRRMPQKQAKLYYLLRTVDTQGSGKVEIDIETIAQTLDLDVKSAKRLLNDAKPLLFRDKFFTESNVYTMYLRCQFEIARSLKIESFADCGFAQVDLGCVLESPKKLGVEIAIKYNQAKNYTALKKKELPKQQKENPYKKVLPIIKNLKPASNTLSEFATGINRVSIKGQDIFVLNANTNVITYNASQQKLAHKLNISVSTLKRLTKNLPHVKVFRKLSAKDVYLRKQFTNEKENVQNNYFFFFEYINNYVERLPNLYFFDLHFCSKRRLKQNFLRFARTH